MKSRTRQLSIGAHFYIPFCGTVLQNNSITIHSIGVCSQERNGRNVAQGSDDFLQFRKLSANDISQSWAHLIVVRTSLPNCLDRTSKQRIATRRRPM